MARSESERLPRIVSVTVYAVWGLSRQYIVEIATFNIYNTYWKLTD